jgi:hypothetical protein
VDQVEHKAECLRFCSSFSDIGKCEIGEFRLQLLFELLVLTGVVSQGHHVADHSYPVQGKGSFRHLQESNVAEVDMMATMQLLGVKLGIERQAYQECLCCEAWPKQKQKIVDVFFQYQSLFLLRRNASGGWAVYRKRYGRREWELLFP